MSFYQFSKLNLVSRVISTDDNWLFNWLFIAAKGVTAESLLFYDNFIIL